MGKFDRHQATSILGIILDDGICYKCKHINITGSRCKAFPKGIPIEVLRGIHKHTKPFKGDNGIQFEPIN